MPLVLLAWWILTMLPVKETMGLREVGGEAPCCSSIETPPLLWNCRWCCCNWKMRLKWAVCYWKWDLWQKGHLLVDCWNHQSWCLSLCPVIFCPVPVIEKQSGSALLKFSYNWFAFGIHSFLSEILSKILSFCRSLYLFIGVCWKKLYLGGL